MWVWTCATCGETGTLSLPETENPVTATLAATFEHGHATHAVCATVIRNSPSELTNDPVPLWLRVLMAPAWGVAVLLNLCDYLTGWMSSGATSPIATPSSTTTLRR